MPQRGFASEVPDMHSYAQATLQYSTLHIEPYKLTGRCPCQILRFWPAGLEWLELGSVVPQQFVSQLCSLLFVATCVGATKDTAICFQGWGGQRGS